MPPVLEVTDVRKHFGPVEALRGVSLAVDEGEMFGLLGPNGAGKTTLLSILAGLLDPTSGSARLLGRPLTRNDFGLKRLDRHRHPGRVGLRRTDRPGESASSSAGSTACAGRT